MNNVMQMNLPWRTLQPKLVQQTDNGLINYCSTFNEFQLRNDHIAKVGVCVPQFLCFFVLHITFYGKKKKYFCLNIVVGSCVILSFLIISSAAAFICNRKMKRRHHLSRRLFIKTRRHWRQYSGLLTKTIQVSNYD